MWKEGKLPPQSHQRKSGKLSCARWATSGFTELLTKAEFGPKPRKGERIQHLLPRKNQACQLVPRRRGQAGGVTAGCGGQVPRRRLPGCPPELRQGARRETGWGGSTPCLCARIQAVGSTPAPPQQLLPQKYHSARFRGHKRHRGCSQGLKQQKRQQPPLRVGLRRLQRELSCFTQLPFPAAPALSTHPAPALSPQEQISPLGHPDRVTMSGGKPSPRGWDCSPSSLPEHSHSSISAPSWQWGHPQHDSQESRGHAHAPGCNTTCQL